MTPLLWFLSLCTPVGGLQLAGHTSMSTAKLIAQQDPDECVGYFPNKIHEILAPATQGNPESVLKAIDEYGWAGNYKEGPVHMPSGNLCRVGFMNIGDVKGTLLDIAVRNKKPRLAVEFGTFMGYSAVRIARLLPEDGHLISVDPAHVTLTAANVTLATAGLQQKVHLEEAYSSDVLKGLAADGRKIDFLFLDHLKELYLEDLQLALSLGVLADGCVITADDVGTFGENSSHPSLLTDFKRFVTGSPRLNTKVYETLAEYRFLQEDEFTISVFRKNDDKISISEPDAKATELPTIPEQYEYCAHLGGNMYTDSYGNSFTVKQDGCSVTFDHKGNTKTGSLLGSIVKVDEYTSDGTVLKDGNVLFADGGVWKKQ